MWLISQFLFNHLVLWYLRSSRMLGRKIRGVVHQIREGRKVQETGTHKGTSTNAVTSFMFSGYTTQMGNFKTPSSPSYAKPFIPDIMKWTASPLFVMPLWPNPFALVNEMNSLPPPPPTALHDL